MKSPILLATFIEVANRGGMAEAARRLHLTPAAVSKHIQALERDLGLALIKRSTRRLELTVEGLTYLEHAKLILDAYRRAEAALSHAKEEPSGLLKMVCGPEIGDLHVLPYLNEFLERYPKVRIMMEWTQSVPNVEQEGIELVVGVSSGIPSHWIQKTLAHAHWTFCASPAYLEKYGMPKKPSDLIQHKVITHSRREPDNVIVFKNGEIVHYEPALYFSDTRAMKKSAVHGQGIVQLHNYIVDQDIRDGRLVPLLHKYVESRKTIPIHISYRGADQLHINVRKFVDFVTSKVPKD